MLNTDQDFPLASNFNVFVFPEDRKAGRIRGTLYWRYGRIPKNEMIRDTAKYRAEDVVEVIEFLLDFRSATFRFSVEAAAVFGEGHMRIKDYLEELLKGDMKIQKILTDSFSGNPYGIRVSPMEVEGQ